MHPQPAQLSQEQMILAQAKNNIRLLEPRLKVLRECLEELQDASHTATAQVETDPTGALQTLLGAMAKVQFIQLAAALNEGERDMANSQAAVKQIESPVKIFRPAGYPPQGPGAA